MSTLEGMVTAMAGNTSNKSVRLADPEWAELGEMAQELGTTASGWIREAVRWGLRVPGARMPQRRLVLVRDDDTDAVGESSGVSARAAVEHDERQAMTYLAEHHPDLHAVVTGEEQGLK